MLRCTHLICPAFARAVVVLDQTLAWSCSNSGVGVALARGALASLAFGVELSVAELTWTGAGELSEVGVGVDVILNRRKANPDVECNDSITMSAPRPE